MVMNSDIASNGRLSVFISNCWLLRKYRGMHASKVIVAAIKIGFLNMIIFFLLGLLWGFPGYGRYPFGVGFLS
jgi:hypothetical protein